MEELIIKYFKGEASENEVQQINDWTKLDEENAKTFTLYKSLWDQLGEVPEESADVEQAWNVIHKRISISPSKNRRRLSSYIYRIAAAVLLLAAISTGLFKYQQQKAGTSQELSTVAASNQKVNLPDGSVVWLRRGAALKYPEIFPGRQRNVELKGEAFFEVAHDSSKPFHIRSGETLIAVLGTSFNVSDSEDGKTIVTVKTGRVAFAADNQSVVLKKGEQGIYDPSVDLILKNDDIDPNVLAWHTGMIVFKESNMEYVTGILEQVYDKKFVVMDPSLKNKQLTTNFSNLTLDATLNILEKTLGIRSQIKGDTVLISNNIE